MRKMDIIFTFCVFFGLYLCWRGLYLESLEFIAFAPVPLATVSIYLFVGKTIKLNKRRLAKRVAYLMLFSPVLLLPLVSTTSSPAFPFAFLGEAPANQVYYGFDEESRVDGLNFKVYVTVWTCAEKINVRWQGHHYLILPPAIHAYTQIQAHDTEGWKALWWDDMLGDWVDTYQCGDWNGEITIENYTNTDCWLTVWVRWVYGAVMSMPYWDVDVDMTIGNPTF